jgi:hypothetical protein
MRRWIRLVWIGLTNGLFLLPFAYLLRSYLLYPSRWDVVFVSEFLESDFVALSIIGFYLEVVRARSARFVNVGLWAWFALRNTLRYFALWGQFSGSREFAFYLIAPALAIAIVNFFFYRSTEELRPNTT